MKRSELKALKVARLQRVEGLQDELRRILFAPSKLPDRVVNGSAQLASEYKAMADKLSGLYHVKNAPGATLSYPALGAVERRLEAVIQSLK